MPFTKGSRKSSGEPGPSKGDKCSSGEDDESVPRKGKGYSNSKSKQGKMSKKSPNVTSEQTAQSSGHNKAVEKNKRKREEEENIPGQPKKPRLEFVPNKKKNRRKKKRKNKLNLALNETKKEESEVTESAQINVVTPLAPHSKKKSVQTLINFFSQSVKEKEKSNVKSPGNINISTHPTDTMDEDEKKKEKKKKKRDTSITGHVKSSDVQKVPKQPSTDTMDEDEKKKEKKKKKRDTSITGHKSSDVQKVPKQPSTDTETISTAEKQEASCSARSRGKGTRHGQQVKGTSNMARVRYLNEQLYTCQGSESFRIFRFDKESFQIYHEGFQSQIAKWHMNPLDIFIRQIKNRPKNLIIADFGCGDARLAQNLPHKVHSFDLVALNDLVTVCDMSQTRLPSEHVDIAVFSLSLMGNDQTDYLLEANRVLKTGGLLKVAEIVSRFSGLSRFTDDVAKLGFRLLNKRLLGTMYYLIDFRKVQQVKRSASTPGIQLKPFVF